MHKIIDMYKMYLVPYICFNKRIAIFKGFLAENYKNFFKHIEWLITILYRELH